MITERDELLVKVDSLSDALEKAETERETLRTGLINAAEHMRMSARWGCRVSQYAAPTAERLAYGGSYPYLKRAEEGS